MGKGSGGSLERGALEFDPARSQVAHAEAQVLLGLTIDPEPTVIAQADGYGVSGFQRQRRATSKRGSFTPPRRSSSASGSAASCAGSCGSRILVTTLTLSTTPSGATAASATDKS